MKSYQSTVVIARPPADVFPYLIEPAKQTLWSDAPMREVTEGPFGTGGEAKELDKLKSAAEGAVEPGA